MLNLAGTMKPMASPITASILARPQALEAEGFAVTFDEGRGSWSSSCHSRTTRCRCGCCGRGPPGPRAGCAGAPGPAAADGDAAGRLARECAQPRRGGRLGRRGPAARTRRVDSRTGAWATTRSSRRCCSAGSTRTPRSSSSATSRPGAASGPGSPGSGCRGWRRRPCPGTRTTSRRVGCSHRMGRTSRRRKKPSVPVAERSFGPAARTPRPRPQPPLPHEPRELLVDPTDPRPTRRSTTPWRRRRTATGPRPTRHLPHARRRRPGRPHRGRGPVEDVILEPVGGEALGFAVSGATSGG